MVNSLRSLWQLVQTANSKRTLGVLALLIVIAAVPLTVMVSQKQQDLRQRASGPTLVTVGLMLDPSTINVTQPNTEQDFTATYTMTGICDGQSYAYFRIGEEMNYLNVIRIERNSNNTSTEKISSYSETHGSLSERTDCTPQAYIENSFLKLDCSKSALSCSGDTLMINAHITVKNPGIYKGYLWLDNPIFKMPFYFDGQDRVNLFYESGTIYKFQASSPVLGNISPQTANIDQDSFRTFTATVSDTAGFSNLLQANMRIFNVDTKYIFSKNIFSIYNGTGQGLACTPGENKILETGDIKFDCSKSSAVGSGNDLNMTWEIAPKNAEQGANASLQGIDANSNDTGWVQKGGPYTVPPHMPTLGNVSPQTANLTTNTYQTFTATISDTAGFSSLSEANMRIFNVNILYQPALNKFTNVNGECTPGENKILETGDIKLDCSKSSATGLGNDLNMTWEIAPKNAGPGANASLQGIDASYNDTGFQQKGGPYTVVPVNTPTPPPTDTPTPSLTNTPTPPPHMPTLGNISPQTANLTTNTYQTFTATISDAAGYSNLGKINLSLFGSRPEYSLSSNKFSNLNGDCTPGENKILETGDIKFDCSKSSAVGSGNDLNMTWEIAPKNAGSGSNASLQAIDKSANNTGFQQKGGPYTVVPVNTPTPPPTNTPTSAPSVTYLAEDVNRSGCVDILDFNILLSAIRSGSAQTGTYPDVNNDSRINLLDFNLWFIAIRSGNTGNCQ